MASTMAWALVCSYPGMHSSPRLTSLQPNIPYVFYALMCMLVIVGQPVFWPQHSTRLNWQKSRAGHCALQGKHADRLFTVSYLPVQLAVLAVFAATTMSSCTHSAKGF